MIWLLIITIVIFLITEAWWYKRRREHAIRDCKLYRKVEDIRIKGDSYEKR